MSTRAANYSTHYKAFPNQMLIGWLITRPARHRGIGILHRVQLRHTFPFAGVEVVVDNTSPVVTNHTAAATMAEIEQWFQAIPPVTRAWFIASAGTSVLVVSFPFRNKADISTAKP